MTVSDATPEDWLTMSEASKILGVHPATLRLWSDDGKIGLFRTPGGHRRFARAEVERLLRLLPVRGAGLSAYVADATVQRTRQELGAALGQQPWMLHLAPAQRDELRSVGRQLTALASQLTNAEATPAQHAVAQAVGQHYGTLLRQAGLDTPDAVMLFLLFRDGLIETVFQLPATTGFDRDATLIALRRINGVLNEALRVMMEQFHDA